MYFLKDCRNEGMYEGNFEIYEGKGSNDGRKEGNY